jgi:hypothetical protein
VAAVLAQAQARSNGHASPPPPAAPAASPAPSASETDDQQRGFCSRHQTPMEQRTDPTSGDTWSSHYDDETGYPLKAGQFHDFNG